MVKLISYNLRFSTKKERKKALETARFNGMSFNEFVLNLLKKEAKKVKFLKNPADK